MWLTPAETYTFNWNVTYMHTCYVQKPILKQIKDHLLSIYYVRSTGDMRHWKPITKSIFVSYGLTMHFKGQEVSIKKNTWQQLWILLSIYNIRPLWTLNFWQKFLTPDSSQKWLSTWGVPDLVLEGREELR